MARLEDLHLRSLLDEEHDGLLVTESRGPNLAEVYYVPSKDMLAKSDRNPDSAHAYRTTIMAIDANATTLTLFPLNTIGGHVNFLRPKHAQVRRITLSDIQIPPFHTNGNVPLTQEDVMGVLEALPSCYTKDYDYGLGLRRGYWSIVEAIEHLCSCSEIIVSRTSDTGIDHSNGIFILSSDDFHAARKAIDRIDYHSQNAARSVKEATVHNIFAEKLSRPTIPVKTSWHPLRKIFTDAATGEERLTDAQQETVMDLIKSNARTIADSRPEQVAQLQANLELATLDSLIVQFEKMLDEHRKERYWQEFFRDNPFVLNMVFGYPLIKVQDQASVGGHRFSGSGGKITDFLAKNALTNNAAIFEIKTPQQKLVNSRSVRSGVYPPTASLSAAISQTLDQKYQLQSSIKDLKHNSGTYDIESFSVHCFLIIGTVPDERDQMKSLEIFRRNSKDVEIVTFDELLEKLKHLHSFLASSEQETIREEAQANAVTDEDDIPF